MEILLRERNIQYLYHFTQAKNLSNIFKYGLLSRKILVKRNIPSYFNDEYRLDKCSNAVCLSIEFPNYKMFYQLRQENLVIDWVVLLLNSEILCDFKCAYCYTNAGNAMIYNIPLEQRMGEIAFLRLFQDHPGCTPREQLGIPDKYPTDPQAEVLVFNSIPIEYIHRVCFENKQTKDYYMDVFPDPGIAIVQPQVFRWRADYEFWR